MAKNDAQTTSEQFQTNFQKVKKTTFLDPKMAKSRVPKISTKNVDFGGLEIFFEPILHESMGPLSPKTMPKQF